VNVPAVLTLHHPHEPSLSRQYARYPELDYVAVGEWLARRESMPNLHVVHHGIPVDDYVSSAHKEPYVAFLGRIVPCKGPHLAIEAAQRAGVRLKLAGEVQPEFREYWERSVRPHIDGRLVEFVGEANHVQKCELLSRARALLFPIQWEEPFGLVMIEAMACGTPVIALAGGAVAEIVRNGVNGWICRDTTEIAERMKGPLPSSQNCRDFVRRHFSVERMAAAYLEIYRHILRRDASTRDASTNAIEMEA
jgi:glycosyltransferase involved in cell wall biosynthesis